MPRKQSLALTPPETQDDIIAGEWLQKYGVDNMDFPDFARAIKVVRMQMENYTLGDAADAIGVSRQVLYQPRWQELMAKARRFLAVPLLESAQVMSNYVYEKWPEVIRSLVNVALNGGRDHEKVAAAELLYQIYMLPVQQEPTDDSSAREYLSKKPNFKNLTPIQVNEGGTVIVNVPKE